ncbi:hypothetical protein [Rhizobium sp. WCS2018Hpa-8]|nr:hypothetical protein [Rhizobium sp. WCS2018Hpa-8]
MLDHFALHRLLRQSVATRLILVCTLIAPLWLAIRWAASLS